MSVQIPFVDLKTQYKTIKSGIDNAIQQVIEETAFVRGKHVDAFEKAFAEAYGVKHCISVANGTDAIYITLKMIGIGQGDEVITVANSWISTSETIGQTGARPVFIDINQYYNIDVSQIERKITSKTKAILPVHLYGQPAKIDTIKQICDSNKLHLIEDCAQGHFAEYKGQKVGTLGIAGTFSFYPGKNLGAYGDAGAIITNDDELAVKIRMYANHGAKVKHQHDIEGVNSRMDGLQAAILSVKLPHIHDWNRMRYEHAKQYNELFKNVAEVVVPEIGPDVSHIFHLYVIRTKKRDELQKFLKQQGVETAIHYPTALPFLRAYEYLGHTPADFPVAYQFQGEILSLPMYPELTEGMIQYVVDKTKEFFSSK
ncbi:MAG: erythromycin biosynthesis sensory transduction protein eryC1 [Syntrophus sp. (in: bacteria)]|nr:erythromycin biosynthesis sensory transduction protein eryC1 [Syntrophus sp. (in: bacteria)]